MVVHDGFTNPRLRFRIHHSRPELLYRPVIEAKLPCEFLVRSACLEEEFPHLFPSLIPPLPIGLLNQQLALAPGSNGSRVGCGFLRSDSLCCLRKQAMMRCNRAAQRFTQVAQQVPAIRNLHGLGSPPPCGFSVDPATVTASLAPARPPRASVSQRSASPDRQVRRP